MVHVENKSQRICKRRSKEITANLHAELLLLDTEKILIETQKLNKEIALIETTKTLFGKNAKIV